MRLLLLCILLALTLTACSTTGQPEPREAPDTLDVPVFTGCPVIENLSKSDLEIDELPIDNITEESSDEETARAYVESILILENEHEGLVDIIKSCKIN